MNDGPAGLEQRRSVRVVFDEAHQEAWSTRPELSATMRPKHPGDASYAIAARALGRRDFLVAVNEASPITAELLEGTAVLVVAHPSDPKWERTTNSGTPVLDQEEIAALVAFVERGGGLVVLGETEQDKYGNNVNDLLAVFGLRIEHATVYDYSSFHRTESWVLADVTSVAAAGFFPRASSACFYRSGVVATLSAKAWLAGSTSPSADPPRAGLIGLARFGAGRVAVFGDSDLFGDDCIEDFDHERLWLDICYWAAMPSFAALSGAAIASHETASPGWLELKAAVGALRALEAPDGSIDLAAHEASTCRAAVERVVAALGALRGDFVDQHEYLDAVVDDVCRWERADFPKPDFSRALAAFHPQLLRRDGQRLLVVFPMYTPNASLDVRFEALVVEVPWPGWVDRLEGSRFDNAKFVPVQLVDATAGYDSECAVLFPETVSASGPAPNAFGAIFCDREAARLCRVMTAATDALALELPPEVQALLASEALLCDVFLLWDLVHDRAHSRGDLPFDPFMVRRRLPYWMYALEELRCDLAAFHEASELVTDGFPFGRYVQCAVLFDRVVRFPVTGTRVRNYDGLGGQVLFGFLHREGVLRWTDNRLRVAWDDLAPAVERLRKEIDELYRSGIAMSRVAYWIAAHDLVARYVPPNLASSWVPGRRGDADESDPSAWIARVDDDEFPLGMFYENLRRRLVASGVLDGAPVPT